MKLIRIPNPTALYCSASPTLRVSYLNVGRWAAEGHSDLLQTGVKGQLPNVADAAGVISGQQVDLGRLHGFLHPFQNLQRRQRNAENAGIMAHLHYGNRSRVLDAADQEPDKNAGQRVWVKPRESKEVAWSIFNKKTHSVSHTHTHIVTRLALQLCTRSPPRQCAKLLSGSFSRSFMHWPPLCLCHVLPPFQLSSPIFQLHSYCSTPTLSLTMCSVTASWGVSIFLSRQLLIVYDVCNILNVNKVLFKSVALLYLF